MSGALAGRVQQGIGCGLLGLLLLAAGCHRQGAPEADAASAAAVPAPGADRIQLDSEAREGAGIELAAAVPRRLEPEVLAFGRVLDPAPVSLAVAGLEQRRANALAADRELRRVEKLAADRQNASQRELEQARAAAVSARAELEMARARVAASLGSALARSADLPALALRLGRREAALLRVDVPGQGAPPDPQRGARLVAYPAPDREIQARFLGAAPDADPNLPGWAFLFLVEADPPPVGTPIRAWLRGPGEPRMGVAIPGSAVLHHEGSLSVFVQESRGGFERRAIQAFLQPDGDWWVSRGLGPGEQVVVRGAQQLLSSSVLPAGGGAAEEDDDD